MQELGIECNYDPCACLVSGSVTLAEGYCSHFCRNAQERRLEAETCACGHPPCDTP